MEQVNGLTADSPPISRRSFPNESAFHSTSRTQRAPSHPGALITHIQNPLYNPLGHSQITSTHPFIQSPDTFFGEDLAGHLPGGEEFLEGRRGGVVGAAGGGEGDGGGGFLFEL